MILFTNTPQIMGEFTNGPVVKILAWVSTLIILGLNIVLLAQILTQK